MGKQVGGTHLVHVLLVDYPAATVIEALGLDQYGMVIGCRYRVAGERDDKRRQTNKNGGEAHNNGPCSVGRR